VLEEKAGWYKTEKKVREMRVVMGKLT